MKLTKKIRAALKKEKLKISSLEELGYAHIDEYAGPVLITSGHMEGHIGYYDDDELDDKNNYSAIVYFGRDYELLAHNDLIPLVDDTSLVTLN